jgi:hypothetical protein
MSETSKKLVNLSAKELKTMKQLRDLGVQQFTITRPDGTAITIAFSMFAAQNAIADQKAVPLNPDAIAALANNPKKDIRVLNRPLEKLFPGSR